MLRTLREYSNARLGRGKNALSEVFRILDELFMPAERAHRLRDFWAAADAVEVLPHRRLIRRSPELLAYCSREALTEIDKAAEGVHTTPWRELSRNVVDAGNRYRTARELPGENAELALRELMKAIDDLAAFHEQEQGSRARALENLIFQVTGARLLGQPNPATQLARVVAKLNDIAHSSGNWTEVRKLRNEAAGLLGHLFRPPDIQLAELDELAVIDSPGHEDVTRLRIAVTNEHHLRYFLERLDSPAWLVRLGPDDLLAPPPHHGPWAMLTLVRRFATRFPNELEAWLRQAEHKWGDRAPAAHHLASLATVAGAAGHHTLLNLMRRYPDEEPIRRAVFRAIQKTEAADPFVTEATSLLLE